jgi:hypothetical protein
LVKVFTMTILPLIFIAVPIVQFLTAPKYAARSKLDTRVGISLLYMLLIPAIVPSTLSAYSVVGAREQGTLELILITPFHREQFLVVEGASGTASDGRRRVHDLRDLSGGDGSVRPSGHLLSRLRGLTHPGPAAVHAAPVRICFALCALGVVTCEVGAAECVGTSCLLVAAGRRGIKRGLTCA